MIWSLMARYCGVISFTRLLALYGSALRFLGKLAGAGTLAASAECRTSAAARTVERTRNRTWVLPIAEGFHRVQVFHTRGKIFRGE